MNKNTVKVGNIIRHHYHCEHQKLTYQITARLLKDDYGI